MKLKDLTGMRFGKLVVISRCENIEIKNHASRPAWICQCDCGNIKKVLGDALKVGKTSSCGCVRRAATSAKNTTHGMSKTPEYNSWMLMIQRCNSAGNKNFKDYGGRGITVCSRWVSSFSNFIADMGVRPTPKHTIDRIDNSLGYYPENCKWSTRREQSQNRRSIRYFSAFGRTMSVNSWGKEIGVAPRTILARIDKLGWPIPLAVSTPARLFNHLPASYKTQSY